MTQNRKRRPPTPGEAQTLPEANTAQLTPGRVSPAAKRMQGGGALTPIRIRMEGEFWF
jgi:hypothetical protein